MEKLVIFGALGAALISYAIVSYRERSLINVLTPSYLISVPIRFVLELFTVFSQGPEYTGFAYCFVYATYALQDLAFAIAYSCWPHRPPLRALVPRPGYRLLGVALIVLAWIVYGPILWQYRDLFSSPREIYSLTRTGYGPLFFGSGLLANVGYVLLLLWRDKPRGLATAGLFACILLGALHGSKSQVLQPFFEWLLCYVYVKENRVGPVRFAAFVGALVAGVMLLFALSIDAANELAGLGGLTATDLIEAIADYSDYNRNAMLIVDHHLDPGYGRLTWENQIYSRLPRFLDPDKPKNFGSFALAEEFYPASFYSEAGAPDFSVGTQYADFGVLSILYLGLWAAVCGVLQRVFVDRYRASNSPGDFIMVLFLAGVPVLAISTFLLPEHLLIAAALNAGLRLRLTSRPTAPALPR